MRAAVGLALSMGLMLMVISVARNQYLNSLSPSQSKAANAAVIDTVSAPLQDTVRPCCPGPARRHDRPPRRYSVVRRWVTGREQPDWLAGGRFHDFLAAHRRACSGHPSGSGLFVLVVWDKPTTLVAVIVVLITLAVIGLVGLLAGRPSHPAGQPDRAPGPDAGRQSRGVTPAPDGSETVPRPSDVARIEAVHAVTYFAPESRDQLAATGLRGFWMGYFAARAAPLGAVGPALVSATFFNFHPSMVERAIPDAWTFAEPSAVLLARRAGAAPLCDD